MRTFEDIFTAFGGPARFAEAVGIEAFHAQTMKARDSIPAAHWSKVVAAAADRGIDWVTLEVLAELAEAKADRRPPLADRPELAPLSPEASPETAEAAR